ncbi:MAG: AbrB family transcriptional regulator [Thermoprotei archaeon]|nr:MAG: AbrB family transcriptional regulator [Thermoprotei archaeon]
MKDEIVKVTRNYQVTIPASVRKKAEVKEGDLVRVYYDESENVIKICKYKRKRLTIKLGKPLTVEEMEEAVEEALDEALT